MLGIEEFKLLKQRMKVLATFQEKIFYTIETGKNSKDIRKRKVGGLGVNLFAFFIVYWFSFITFNSNPHEISIFKEIKNKLSLSFVNQQERVPDKYVVSE